MPSLDASVSFELRGADEVIAAAERARAALQQAEADARAAEASGKSTLELGAAAELELEALERKLEDAITEAGA